MPKVVEGTLSAAGLRIALVASRFNALIVEPLVAGAVDAIVRTGGADGDVTLYRCPGAWELPQVVRQSCLHYKDPTESPVDSARVVSIVHVAQRLAEFYPRA